MLKKIKKQGQERQKRLKIIREIVLEHKVKGYREIIEILKEYDINKENSIIFKDVKELLDKGEILVDNDGYYILNEELMEDYQKKLLSNLLKNGVNYLGTTGEILCTSFEMCVIRVKTGYGEVIANLVKDVFKGVLGTIIGVGCIIILVKDKEALTKLEEGISKLKEKSYPGKLDFKVGDSEISDSSENSAEI